MSKGLSASVLVVLLLAMAGVAIGLDRAQLQPSCTASGPSSEEYSITLCITAPGDDALLEGVQHVTLSATVSGTDPGIDAFVFYLDGSYLSTDLARSGMLELSTGEFVDGSRALAVEALMKDGFVSDQASINVTFANGITEPPVKYNAFGPHPESPPPVEQSLIISAADDGASRAEVAIEPDHNRPAQSGCSTSAPSSEEYSITLCMTTPGDGAVLVGVQDITLSTTVSGVDPGVDEYVFYLDGAYLLTDLGRSGTFELPTERFVDGTRSLAVEALMKDGFVPDRASISVTFDNGITEPPVNNNSFTPHTGSMPPAGQPFILSAVGDGASGLMSATQVSDLILSWDPDIFLYLGDVYEHGSVTEFFNWYGTESRFFGRLRHITNPTIGNHEYLTGNGAGYFDYWDNIPHYYSFDAAGWHIISLDLTSSFNQRVPGTAQYEWLVQELRDNASVCTLVYFHHPRFSVGTHGDTTSVQEIWSLLAQHGVDLVTTGHEHNYQHWQPLDSAGSPDPQGVTQFIVGGGGKNITPFASADARLAVGFDTAPEAFGALRLELNQDGAGFRFVNIDGTTLDSGAIHCSGAPADIVSPSSPSLTGDSNDLGHIELDWTSAIDNVGVISYTIDRNGHELATVNGGNLAYDDGSVQLGSTYTYTVEAVDTAGNRSLPSNTVAITAQTSILEFGATDDATISQATPGTNFGAEPILVVDGSPPEDTLLRFDVSGVGIYTVTKAILKLYAMDGSNLGGEFAAMTETSWSEDTVTSDTAPAGDGRPLGELGSVRAGNWYELDVTPLVLGDGPVSIRITSTSANGASYASKENENGNGPQLIVTFDRTGSADVTRPSAPANLGVSQILTGEVTLLWDASHDNVGVVGYDLFRDSDLLASIGTMTIFSDTAVTPDTTYHYFVRARDAAGNVSDPSNTIEVTTLDSPPVDFQPSPPYRLAFYYPWFPDAWTQRGIFPYTNYDPLLGFYDSGDSSVIQQQIEAMQYGGIEGAVASWWGQGHHTDLRMTSILSATGASDFRWSVYHEGEGQGDPTVAAIRSDLIYLSLNYGNDPSYFRIDGRFVVFVYADPGDGCGMVERWSQANDVAAYLVLKVFPGYRDCLVQPDGWHQYAPAAASDSQTGYSYTISPGFWKVSEQPRLTRDLARWRQNIRDMIDSAATFQLITTFNEWGEGSSVEAALEWSSDSGYGAYLDALHDNGESDYQDYLPIISDSTHNIPSPDPILVGAGDIAECDRQDDEATADLLDSIPGTVYTTGDTVYESGTAEEFSACYEPSWGRHKDRTRPTVGNHEYRTPDASGYFDYFGAAAGDPNKGYYSYDLGQWHVIALNSNCSDIGGCEAGSPQEQWLRQDLAANPTLCTVAYWHHPRFNSGKHGNQSSMQDFWQALYDYDVDVVLNGHAHHYERFAQQDPNGQADPEGGIREFIVGTGGKSHYPVGTLVANSEVFNDDTFGVLQLTLHPTGYTWEFIPVSGKTFTDSGSQSCH